MGGPRGEITEVRQSLQSQREGKMALKQNSRAEKDQETTYKLEPLLTGRAFIQQRQPGTLPSLPVRPFPSHFLSLSAVWSSPSCLPELLTWPWQPESQLLHCP